MLNLIKACLIKFNSIWKVKNDNLKITNEKLVMNELGN